MTNLILLNLPDDVLRVEIFPCLSLQDISHLDISVCNHHMRSLLFKVYGTLKMEHSSSGLDKLQLTWFSHRSIRLKHKLKICHNSSPIEESAIYLFGSGLKDLTHLDLTRCAFLSDAAVIALADTCPLLMNVDMSFCRYNISDAAVIAMSQRCTMLSHLDITCCMNITDDAVIELARNLKEVLTEMNIRGCVRITDKSALFLVQECPLMAVLKLCFCYNTISQYGVTALRAGVRSISTRRRHSDTNAAPLIVNIDICYCHCPCYYDSCSEVPCVYHS